jgi:hypothetical protein
MSSHVIRLNEIMLAAKSIRYDATYIAGWGKIFGENNRAEICRKIGLVQQLVERAAEEAIEITPSQKTNVAHWHSQIARALFDTEKGSQWQHFLARIDNHSFGYLSAQAELCAIIIKPVRIDAEKISEASSLLRQAIEEIRSSDLSSDVKMSLVRRIRAMADALDDYIITGDDAIFDEFKITLIDLSAATDKNIDIPAKSKIREGLAIVSDLMSTAGGLATLAPPIAGLLGRI